MRPEGQGPEDVPKRRKSVGNIRGQKREGGVKVWEGIQDIRLPEDWGWGRGGVVIVILEKIEGGMKGSVPTLP